jgi:hypothetical protein
MVWSRFSMADSRVKAHFIEPMKRALIFWSSIQEPVCGNRLSKEIPLFAA